MNFRMIVMTAVCFFLIGINGVSAAKQKEPVVCEALNKSLATSSDFELAQHKSAVARLAKEDDEKAAAALKGINHAERCLVKEPSHVGCHYYRAVNRGYYAETKTAGVDQLLTQMISDFEWVIAKDSTYDQGGAYTALGTLYFRLPSFPVFGSALRRDLKKAEDYLQKALAISDDEIDTLKLAGDFYYKKKDYKKSEKYFKKLRRVLKKKESQNHLDQEIAVHVEQHLKKIKKKL